MLVIGITETAHPIHSDLDIDLATDSPRKIIAALSKATLNKKAIVQVLCIENDEVVESFQEGEDYELDEADKDAIAEDEDEIDDEVYDEADDD